MKHILKKSKLDIEIENLTETLIQIDPTSPEYQVVADNLKRLVEIKASKGSKFAGINKDTLLKLAVIVGEVVLITNYEQFNVLTTKSLGFIPKVRI